MPFQLLTLQMQNELSFAQGLARFFVEDLANPSVPEHDRAGPIIARRDGSLEIGVFDGMILHLNGQALFALNHGHAFGDRPRFQNAVQFEPKIIMQPARRMFLDDEKKPAPGALMG